MRIFRSAYHYLLARFGSVVYGNPSKKLFVVGVTGTKGKSTVIEIINAILEAAGKKTALLSSVRFKIDQKSQTNLTGMSMPGRLFIQKFLSETVKAGCEFAIIEVTSQGIMQHRHRFVDFGAAIMTNLEPEHIEAHGSFEDYRASKVKFFRDVALHSERHMKTFLINSDAKDNQFFADAVRGRGRIIYYNKKDVREFKIKTRLIGDFNFENIAAAIAFARSLNIDWDTIKNAVESFSGVPGRLEFVQKVPFSVVIDYAHTPDSLEKVYYTLHDAAKLMNRKRGAKPDSGKLICVLGSAGGGRDIWKRPVMGKIASDHCDRIFLTNEDPFNENPDSILDDIVQGIPEEYKGKVKRIMEREEAIRMAIKSAKKGDTVVITGKGCEPYLRIKGGKKIPWNEKSIVTRILNEQRIEMK